MVVIIMELNITTLWDWVNDGDITNWDGEQKEKDKYDGKGN